MKNLIAHKLKNKVTTIIYALSLAFIILCVVAYKLEFKNFEVNEAKDVSDLEYRSVWDHYIESAAKYDEILMEFDDQIEGFGWQALEGNFINTFKDTLSGSAQVSNPSEIYSKKINVKAVSPHLFSSH